MPKNYPLVNSLAESVERASRKLYEDEAERAPGGEWIRPHVYEGPYSLVTLVGFNENDADFKAVAVVSAFPPIEIRLNQGYDPEDMLLLAVPKYAHRVLEWYADGETSYTVSEIELASYDQPVTDRDLALALPELLGYNPVGNPNSSLDPDEYDELVDVFGKVFDTVGIAPMLTLLRKLGDDIVEDPDALRAAIEGVLTAPPA